MSQRIDDGLTHINVCCLGVQTLNVGIYLFSHDGGYYHKANTVEWAARCLIPDGLLFYKGDRERRLTDREEAED